MNPSRNLGLAAFLLAGLPLSAQTAKVSGLLQVWHTQMFDHNLRLNAAAPGGYYNLRGEFKENTFSLRRTEIKFSGNILPGVDYEAMIDPAISTSASNPSILQDAAIILKLFEGVELKAGQFKNLQTHEGVKSSSELIFAERSQLGRTFGDKRDRGASLSFAFGDPKGFHGKATVAAFNGMNDAAAGKANDTNAAKDFVGRLEFNLAKVHAFGVYTLQGDSDVTDKTGATIAANPGGAWPAPSAIFASKDKTTNLGAFYVYEHGPWHASAEYMTGLLGRRFPTLAATAPAVKREHLDQTFSAFYLTGAYTAGRHTFAARYDVMDLNQGGDWYTATNPYTTDAATGAATGADYTPDFTEATLGYTYAWIPGKVKAANLKLNYVARSKNFLRPRNGQNGEQGGNSLVAALQIAF